MTKKDTNKINLIDQLVNKSIEAFIVAIELYNKPTIKYRIEGFSFFICNAWELMLKAEIIKRENEDAIYFKDNPDRTISLNKCISKIFTNKNSNLRKNLEKIESFRNQSTHFIVEEYEYLYAPLFQACINNYSEKMVEFHEVNISEHISQNFLTLSVNRDTFNVDDLKAKYTPRMVEKIIKENKKTDSEIKDSNTEFAIPIKMSFYVTKNKDLADLTVNPSSTSDTNVTIIKDIKNPNNIYNKTQKEIINLINKKLKAENILLTVETRGEQEKRIFNKHHFGLFINFYNIKNNKDFCFHYELSRRYGYNIKLVDFIVEKILEKPETIICDLEKAIKNTK